MTIIEAGVLRFGQPFVEAIQRTAGCHSENSSGRPPLDAEGRFVFGLLEAVDFGCPNFAWECPGRGLVRTALKTRPPVCLADIQDFLLSHREAVLATKCPPPSWLGLLAGNFDFLG